MKYPNIIILPFIILLFYSFGFSENDIFIPVHIDGSNTILFNQEYPAKSYNMYGLIFGNPLDRFPFTYCPAYNVDKSTNDSMFFFHLFGSIGSETGELLLNHIEGVTTSYNRDHMSRIASSMTIPYIPASLYFGYRYLDIYSDRFDRYWSDYENKTGKKMSSTLEGLAYEFFGGFHVRGKTVSSSLKVVDYNRWGTTPFYFSPLYTTGTTLMPSMLFNLANAHTLTLDFFIDYHEDYSNHHTATQETKYADNGWNFCWEGELKETVHARIAHQRDTRITPSMHCNAMVIDSVADLFSWTLNADLYGNLHPGFSFDVSYFQHPNFTLDLKYAWEYKQKPRDFMFWEFNKPVYYYGLNYTAATLHTKVSYHDTLFFPLSLSLWYDYNEKPLWETIKTNENKVIINQEIFPDASHATFGGKGSYKVHLKNFSATLWGNAILSPSRSQRFSLPLNLGADFAYGNPDNDSLYAAIQFENRARTKLTYFNKDTNKEIIFTAPAQTSVLLTCKIPFLSPFFRDYINTSILVEAGPIRLTGEQRVKEHPHGNLIGPAIIFAVQGNIKKYISH